MKSSDEFGQTLNEKGLKATKERVALLTILDNARKPLTIADILDLDKDKVINQATVYRSIGAFKEKGLVKQISLNKDSAYFELADFDHHHIVCTNCGRIEDFVGCDFKTISKQALKQSKFFKNINEHSLEFFSVCLKCQ